VRPRRTYHHGDLREALLRSVGRIIRKHGVGSVSLREVARDARVSHSAPAHHFGNKRGLLTAFAAQGFDALAEAVEANMSDAEDGPARLEALGRGYVRFAIDNPDHFGVMFRADLLQTAAPEYRRAADRAFTLLSSAIRACVEQGFLANRDIEAVTAAAWALAHGAATLAIGGRLQARAGAGDGYSIAARALESFVDGVVRAR
jgi:AcrR family transcriptional regulator